MKSADVAFYLVQRKTSPMYLRKNMCVVENVSWGFNLSWEADLVYVTKSMTFNEVEIKVSFQDWKQDAEKDKFKLKGDWDRHRTFWYAAPLELAKRYEEVWTREGSGIIGVLDNGAVQILRKPKPNTKSDKLTETELIKLMRLGCMRAFRRKA